MRTWAFVSQKGGPGKTTLATQLAVYAGELGEKVVILDVDTQQSTWKWHCRRGEGTSPTVLQCPYPEKIVAATEAIRQSKVASLLFIDTPPHSNAAAIEAIRACDLIVVPVRPGMVEIDAVSDTARLLAMSEATGRALGVVNQVPGQGAVKTYSEASGLIERLGIRVAGAYVRTYTEFTKATDVGKGVTQTAKSSQAAKDIVALWGELNETPPLVAVHTLEAER